jgi:hypothetical protein
LLTVPDSLPVDQRLIEIGLASIQFAREHPAELDLLFDSLSALSPKAQDESLEVLTPTPLFQIVQRVLEDGSAHGVLHARDEGDLNDPQVAAAAEWVRAAAQADGLFSVTGFKRSDDGRLGRCCGARRDPREDRGRTVDDGAAWALELVPSGVARVAAAREPGRRGGGALQARPGRRRTCGRRRYAG